MGLSMPFGSRLSLVRYGEDIPLRTLHVTVYFQQIDRLTAWDTTDSHFRKVHGLSNYNHVSFESVKRPGRYLRHYGPDSRVELSDGLFDPWFGEHATFRPRWGPGTPSWASVQEFEAVNYPGYYLRKVGDHLRLTTQTNSEAYSWGFVERNPVSLGHPVNWGGWTSTNNGPWYIERWGYCTGLTPLFGQPKVTSINVVLTTGRVVVSAAVSLPYAGLYPLMRLNGCEYAEPYMGAVYSIDRWVLPCVW